MDGPRRRSPVSAVGVDGTDVAQRHTEPVRSLASRRQHGRPTHRLRPPRRLGCLRSQAGNRRCSRRLLPSGALRCCRSRLACFGSISAAGRKDESRASRHGRAQRGRTRVGRCAWQESNLRPRAPEARALSPELQAQGERNLRFALRFRPEPYSTGAWSSPTDAPPCSSPRRFAISRETSSEEEVLWVEIRHDDVSGFGEATPQAHYGESIESASAFLDEAGDLLGDDPFALETIGHGLAEPSGRARREGGRRRRAPRSLRKAGRASRLPSARPRADRAADLLDDLARRPRRHGPACRGRRPALPSPEAEARRSRRPRRRASPCGSLA